MEERRGRPRPWNRASKGPGLLQEINTRARGLNGRIFLTLTGSPSCVKPGGLFGAQFLRAIVGKASGCVASLLQAQAFRKKWFQKKTKTNVVTVLNHVRAAGRSERRAGFPHRHLYHILTPGFIGVQPCPWVRSCLWLL